jgi:hypothetical protein
MLEKNKKITKNQTKNRQKNFFWPKQKNTCLMILNDKPNCQVSRILMNPRPILSDSSENDPRREHYWVTWYWYII